MGKSKKKFKTEVQQLLDLVIHSLYSNKEIFLRELISNASDALDRRRFEALSNDAMDYADDGRVKLIPDKDAGTLTISDNGVGMSRDELERNIGTIANSGTRAFLEELRQGNVSTDSDFIGQFGVGFYSAFMVADKVELVTRRADAGADAGWRWVSTGDGSYTVEEYTKDEPGTDITLFLKTKGDDADENADEMTEYLEEWRLKKVVKQYSDFVEYPVVMDVRHEDVPRDDDGKAIEGAEPTVTIEEETLNSMKAIWTRSSSDVEESEYNEFYKHISHDWQDPLHVIHYTAEGLIEFRALLYLPAKAPWDLFHRDDNRQGLHLYVKRIFIMDDCRELMPEYLRFVKGVVECNDLPLNVSRELLQEDRMIKRIQKSLVSKVLGSLKELKDKKHDDYMTFYSQFGKVLKEGLHFDFANKEKLQELVYFESSKTTPGKLTSLREYRERMPDAQTDIFYITGDNRAAVENSPHLEAFRSRDYEVLFLTDPIDEWVVQGLTEYDGKKLTAVDRGDIELDADDEDKEKRNKEKEAAQEQHKDLLESVQKKLDEHVSEVRFSNRLTESASCLVASEGGMSANMERIFKAMNQETSPTKRILELNAGHPIVHIMQALFDNDPESQQLDDYVHLLHDQALLSEGSSIADPQRFTRTVTQLMVDQGTVATAK